MQSVYAGYDVTRFRFNSNKCRWYSGISDRLQGHLFKSKQVARCGISVNRDQKTVNRRDKYVATLFGQSAALSSNCLCANYNFKAFSAASGVAGKLRSASGLTLRIAFWIAKKTEKP